MFLPQNAVNDKREEQKEKRRQDILRAGLKLFTCKGYEATKINDIAAEAGMSLGLLYHYFKSVEDLHEELINIALLRTHRAVLSPI